MQTTWRNELEPKTYTLIIQTRYLHKHSNRDTSHPTYESNETTKLKLPTDYPLRKIHATFTFAMVFYFSCIDILYSFERFRESGYEDKLDLISL